MQRFAKPIRGGRIVTKSKMKITSFKFTPLEIIWEDF